MPRGDKRRPVLRGSPGALRCAGRVLACVIALFAARWLLWNPVSNETLLLALPQRSVAAALVRGIAFEEKALVEGGVFAEAVAAFGEDPQKIRENNSGTFATLFWLTGRRSAVAIVPEPGECAGLGFYLAGTSATGWKTKILEALWRIKFVPFLGPLRTTGNGTRYMEFSGHGFLPENKIVLGLDIVDGVLCAVLAQDPSRVEEVAARVRSARLENAAPCFGTGGGKKNFFAPIRHRAWISSGILPAEYSALAPESPVVVDFDSFKKPGLRFSAVFDAPETFSQTVALGEPGQNAALDGALCPLEGLIFGFCGNVSGSGPVSIWASTAPFAGRLSIVEAPAVRSIVALGENVAAKDWMARFKTDINARAAALKPRWRSGGEGAELLHFKNLRTNLFGETPDEDCSWMRGSGDGKAVFLGTHLGSAMAQDAACAGLAEDKTLGHSLRKIAQADPSAFAVAHVDFSALSGAARSLGAIVALARRMGLKFDGQEASAIDGVLSALAAMRGLGVASISLSKLPEEDGDSTARMAVAFDASGPGPESDAP